MSEVAAIVLAAGKGTRMKSDMPKVLFEVCGKPMVLYVCEAAKGAGAERIIVVVGHKEELVRQALAHEDGVEFATQQPQLGTGHAAAAAEALLKGFGGTVLVLNGDAPLMETGTLRRLLSKHHRARACCTLLTSVDDAQGGKGRVVRDSAGRIVKVVEETEADAEQKRIAETNSGFYCFDARSLFEGLKELRPSNRKKEYYITDVVEVIHRRGKEITNVVIGDSRQIIAPNSQKELAEANRVMQGRILDRLMASGVCVVDPNTTMVEAGVRVGRETILYPFTYVCRGAKIGKRCKVGPFAFVGPGERVPDDGIVGRVEGVF